MRKTFVLFFLSLFIVSFNLPVVDAATRIRKNTPARYTTTQYRPPVSTTYYTTQYVGSSVSTNTYYYSQTYLQGYTYSSTPTPGYYYYPNSTNTNSVVQIIPAHSNSNHYYTPQNYTPGSAAVTVYSNGQYYYPGNYTYVTTVASYPGCNKSNIIIGGQEWSACNSIDRNTSSSQQSGWFFAGDMQSTFLSYNGMWNSLAWQGKQTRNSSWTQWPCAEGYRIPTRHEWETAIFYARQNGKTLATLLGLPYNGAFYGYRDSDGNVTLSNRADVNWAYWTSTIDGSNPTILHLASGYAGYRTDGTDYSRSYNSTRWQYGETGLSLIQSNYSEIANVRCIKK